MNYIRIIKASYNVYYRIDFTDIREKFISQALAF